MKVIVLNKEGTAYLTKGKIYDVIERIGDTFRYEKERIVNDVGKEFRYDKERFEIFSCDNCTTRKCNNCELNTKI